MAFAQQILPTNDWERARLGKLTSSEISVLLVEGKNQWGLGAGALSYCEEKVSESMTGTYRGFTSYATEHGNTNEPRAIERLKRIYPNLTYYGEDNRKFFKLNDIAGGSPDADDGANLVAEIKAPEDPKVHLRYLRIKSQAEFSGACKELQQGTSKKNYYTQLQCNMLCVAKEREIPFDQMKGIFVSYGFDFDPEFHVIPKSVSKMFGDSLVMKILPIDPDIDLMQKLLEKIQCAHNYMDWYIKDLLKTVNK